MRECWVRFLFLLSVMRVEASTVRGKCRVIIGALRICSLVSSKICQHVLRSTTRTLEARLMVISCVPKKVTWNAATIAEHIHDAAAYGFSIEHTAPFDMTTFKGKRDDYVKRLNDIYKKNLDKDHVEFLHGRAHLTSSSSAEVDLDDGSKVNINAKKILLATGGHPNPPPKLPGGGGELGINSDGFFDLAKLPKRVALVGAGYIAVEMAGMFHHLGSETHLFIRHQNFLRPFDPMIQDTITAEYERQGIHIHRYSSQEKVEKIEDKEGWIRLHYKDSSTKDSTSTLELDCLLWAIGRSPETEDLGLEKAGVNTGPKGHISVDEYQNTNIDNIYALGDVTGQVELTPVAIAAGRRLADRLFGGPQFKDSKLVYENIPSVVFAHPEVGSIGLTEPAAREKFGDENIKVYNTTFISMYYALMAPEDKPPAKFKVICEGPEERVVGLHILGQGCSEMLQGFGVAVKMGAKKKDLDSCVAIHPTNAEELVTLT